MYKRKLRGYEQGAAPRVDGVKHVVCTQIWEWLGAAGAHEMPRKAAPPLDTLFIPRLGWILHLVKSSQRGTEYLAVHLFENGERLSTTRLPKPRDERVATLFAKWPEMLADEVTERFKSSIHDGECIHAHRGGPPSSFADAHSDTRLR